MTAYYFVSGDIEENFPVKEIRDHAGEFNPKLNYFFTPLIVSPKRGIHHRIDVRGITLKFQFRNKNEGLH